MSHGNRCVSQVVGSRGRAHKIETAASLMACTRHKSLSEKLFFTMWTVVCDTPYRTYVRIENLNSL